MRAKSLIACCRIVKSLLEPVGKSRMSNNVIRARVEGSQGFDKNPTIFFS